MMEISWIHLVILTLAAFRFTRLIMYDEITSFIRAPFLTITADYDDNMEITHNIEIKGSGLRYWIGTLLTCHWCVGIWSSIIIIALYYYLPSFFPLLLMFAIAGAAALIASYLDK
ncbi:DUF1360 domain-containing protein [Bacillus sp. 37MA]|uniref:DUF1360 domain-containing protein n=1 Tax=Bacillus sp. 37MA TaxID=1132442 RepID=UPI000361552D|nr:DUF1360 domain-containing protein [Bacillus sp. 37MA]